MKFWRGKEPIGVGRLGLMLGVAILARAFETVTQSRSRCRRYRAKPGELKAVRPAEERGKKVERRPWRRRVVLVPGAGLEPARTLPGPRDFKSRVSTNSTIRAQLKHRRKTRGMTVNPSGPRSE